MGKAERQQKRLAVGWQALERGDLRAAEHVARDALERDRRDTRGSRLLGQVLLQQGRFSEALVPLGEVFRDTKEREAGCQLGHGYLLAGDPKGAEAVLEQLVRSFPGFVDGLNLLGIALVRQSRYEEAVKVFSSALERDPRVAGTSSNMGNALLELERYEDAIPYFRKAIELQPDFSQAHNSLALAYRGLKRFGEALGYAEQACRAAPNDPTAFNNLGAILAELGRLEEAVANQRKAVALAPDYATAYADLGRALHRQGYVAEAIECYRISLLRDPRAADVHGDLGAAYQQEMRIDEAAQSYRKAIELDPRLASACNNLGLVLQHLGRHTEAIAYFRLALEIEPGRDNSLSNLAWSELMCCRWTEFDIRTEAIRRSVAEGGGVTEPFVFVAIPNSPEEQQICATAYTSSRSPDRASPPAPTRHEKIRLAYLSADFQDHVMAHCLAELFEIHDRSRFEVIAVSFGPDDRSEMRARLARGVDRFLDVRASSDADMAKAVRDLEVDIAIDLMGHTAKSRPAALARRPAPIQVNYLGYPGTMGAEFIDYILADRFVLPEEHQSFYTEKVVYLPDSYQVNDSKRAIAADARTRTEAGLPPEGFVFCCFNSSYKIQPRMFDIWMRLLRQVPGSVLWLLRNSALAEENLRNEAHARDIGSDRLVFAPRVGIADYRARSRLADLYLDTLPYTGHGTTSDMLWAGLPVLTCAGNTFAGRVAGSLLHAVGLPELVTTSLEEYEALGLKLATDPHLLKELRARLERNRNTAPLFDTDRFRRHIESAYTTMWEVQQRGEPPRAFAVDLVE